MSASFAGPEPKTVAPKTVAVIGAGIVGVSAALYLQRDGHRVILIDREGPAAGASYGNAGGLISSACAPIAMPGLLAKLPRMLLDPKGPARIGWRHLPRATPYLLRFLRNAAPDRVARNADAMAALNSRIEAPWRDLAKQAGVGELLHIGGWLKVYESDAGFAASRPERDLMTERGRPFELLDRDELRQLEPSLAPIFKHGFLQPEGFDLQNPGRAVKAFAADFVARGGQLEIAEVTGFETGARPLRLLTAGRRGRSRPTRWSSPPAPGRGRWHAASGSPFISRRRPAITSCCRRWRGPWGGGRSTASTTSSSARWRRGPGSPASASTAVSRRRRTTAAYAACSPSLSA